MSLRSTFVHFVCGLIIALAAPGCSPGELHDGLTDADHERYAASLKHKLGYLPNPADYNSNLKRRALAATALPSYFNWMKKGVVTPAKDQGFCGSCWAFATVGVIESKIMIRNGPRYDLSEQQQVSCNTASFGCNGGYLSSLKFYYDKGPMQEACTGYSATNGSCAALAGCAQLPHRTSGFYTVYTSSPTEIKRSLHDDGPASFAFAVYYDFYSFWGRAGSGEVYRNTNGSLSGYHAVLLVGWDDAKRAYLLKNSWGTGGPNGNGTFWMAYDGHAHPMSFYMSNVDINMPKPCVPQPDPTLSGRCDGSINTISSAHDRLNLGCADDEGRRRSGSIMSHPGIFVAGGRCPSGTTVTRITGAGSKLTLSCADAEGRRRSGSISLQANFTASGGQGCNGASLQTLSASGNKLYLRCHDGDRTRSDTITISAKTCP